MLINDAGNYLMNLNDNQWKKIEHLIEMLTLIIIFWTAHETSRASKANNRAIKISTLPVLLIDFRKKQNNYTVYLKNFRNIPVYDIKVEKWLATIKDAQVTWSMDIRNKGINLIEGNSEKELLLIFKENNKEIRTEGNGIIMHAVFGSGLPLLIEYKNFLGEKFYTISRISFDPETNEHVQEMMKHPTKIDLSYYLYKLRNYFNGMFIKTYYGLIWKLEKPHFASESTKYDIVSVVTRYLKNR